MKPYLSTNSGDRLNSDSPGYSNSKNDQKLLFPKESFSTSKQQSDFQNTDENFITYEELAAERNQLQKIVDIQNALTEELISSNHLTNILGILKEYIKLPIIIENHKKQITDCENIDREDASQLQSSFHKELKKWDYKRTEFIELENHSRLFTPIFSRDKIWGYCSFIYDSNSPKPNDFDRMILGILTSISTLVYLNNKNIMEANARTKGILFEKILSDEFESKEQIYRELKLLNIDVTGKYHVAFLSLKYDHLMREDDLSIFTSVYEEVIQFFQEKNCEVLQVQRANGILCFIPEDGELDNFKSGPQHFFRRIKQNYKIECHVGVSSTNNDLKHVNSLMKEAITAARFTIDHKPTMFFEELGILGILVHSQEENAIKKIAELELGEIYGQTEQQKEYMLTLYKFLINGGNLEQTSANLKLSVSGLRYRINRIREILQKDLKNPKEQFDLLLALKALKVIGEF